LPPKLTSTWSREGTAYPLVQPNASPRSRSSPPARACQPPFAASDQSNVPGPTAALVVDPDVRTPLIARASVRSADATGSFAPTGTSARSGTIAVCANHASFSNTVLAASACDSARSSWRPSACWSVGSGRPAAPCCGAARVM
jgi:hypothetical protein